MRLFRTVAAAAVTLALASGMAAAEWTKVRIGTEGAYPPFNYMDSAGNLQGFDIDIANALCEKMQVECEFVAQDWDGIIPALLAERYDAIIASMSITEERAQKVDFTEPYYNTPAKFVTRKDGGVTDVSPEALAGKNLGAQSATIHANYLEEFYPDANIRLYGTQDEANADLAAGRLDAVIADSVVLWEWTTNAEEGQCCHFVGPDITEPERIFGKGAGIAVRQEDDDLKEMLNKALEEILEDGTYKEINDKYFPFDVYGS